MKKQIFFVGAATLGLSMIIFTSQGYSQELNGCWKDENKHPYGLEKICFSDMEIKYDDILLKIKDKKNDGGTVIITYTIDNSTNTAKIQFLEKDKIHLTLPQYNSTFIKEEN